MTIHDTDFTDNPICPHCGHEYDSSLWGELFQDEGPDGDIDIDCENCAKSFNAQICTTWNFTTVKIEDDNEAGA